SRRRYCFTTRAEPLHRLFHKIDFVNRVDVDRVNARSYRVVNLVVRFTRAVEDDLVGPETDPQCFEEFAAAVDFDIDSRFQHDLENRHVRVCLRRVAKLDRSIDCISGELQALDVVPDAVLGKYEQRGVEFFDEFQSVNTTDGQVIVAHFQVTRYRPRGTQRG